MIFISFCEYAFYNELVKYDAARAKVDLYE